MNMSKSKLKVQDDVHQTMYAMHRDSTVTVDVFRRYVVELIRGASKPNFQLIDRVNKLNSKDQIVIAATNFLAKGMGFGVIK